jgi:hypothetical protein
MKTMRNKTLSLLLSLVLLAGIAGAQSRVTLTPPADGDLAPNTLVAPVGTKAAAVPTEPVSLSWGLDQSKALEAPAPFVAQSREYFLDLTADELGAGVDFATLAPGALLRLNPAPGSAAKAAPLDPLRISVTTAEKATFAGGTGFDQLASSDQLKAAGAPFVEGTVAFRLSPEVGAGALKLTVSDLEGTDRYVLHVFDRGSDAALALNTDRASYLHGGTLVAEARLAGARVIEGFVTSPAGRAWPVSFEALGDGLFRASLELDALEAPVPGLWQVHASAEAVLDGVTFQRNARTAFDVAVPSARLNGEVSLAKGAQMGVRLGVEAAAAGRYEVRGVLYGTARDGSQLPVAVAHSAAWLEAGNGELLLTFDRQALVDSGLRAPFAVRDLRLLDQGNLALLQHQDLGLVIE